MSDWVSVYSAVGAANAGLDLEMPHPVWFKDRLLAAVQDGRVSEAVIDDKVRRQLRVRFLAGLFDNPAPAEDESIIRSESHRNLALEMARKSIVLLKNDRLLPLARERIKTIALIGPHAKTARTGGGGSSMVQPWETVSPYEGVAALLGNQVKIAYAEGTHIDPVRPVPLPSKYLRTPDGRSEGLLGEYFANSRFEGPPVFTRIDPLIDFNFSAAGADPRLSLTDFAVRWTGKFLPPVTRRYRLAISSDDGSRLTINGRLMVDNWGQHGEVIRSCDVPMEAGKEYEIQIDYNQVGGDASMRLGWQNPD
jgi:beta-glucosidase